MTVVSVTLIVSAYMAGLGAGSRIRGRIARNFKNTLFLYGTLEIGIALFGLVSSPIIVWVGQATAGAPYSSDPYNTNGHDPGVRADFESRIR